MKLWVRFPALAGGEPALAGGVHEACPVTVWRARPPVVDEVAGGYRPAGDVQPPSFPLAGRLRWLLSGQQVVPAQRAAPVLPGEQAQGVPVERGLACAVADWPSNRPGRGRRGTPRP